MKARMILAMMLFFAVSAGCEPKQQVYWETFASEKIGATAQAGKPAIAYFYAAWCSPCMALKYETFSDARVIQSLEPFIRLKADLSFSHSEKSRQLANRYHVAGLPTVVFFDASGHEVVRFSGFVNAEQFLVFLNRYEPRFGIQPAVLVQQGNTPTN